MDIRKIPPDCLADGALTRRPVLLLKNRVRLHFYEGSSIGFYVPEDYMKGKKPIGLLRRNYGPNLTTYSLAWIPIRDTAQANCLLSHALRYPLYSGETPSRHGDIIARVVQETISQLIVWGALEIDDLWI